MDKPNDPQPISGGDSCPTDPAQGSPELVQCSANSASFDYTSLQLPEEIWLEIFRRIDISKRASLILVCRAWTDLLLRGAPALWRVVRTYDHHPTERHKRHSILSGNALAQILSISRDSDLQLTTWLEPGDNGWRSFVEHIGPEIHRVSHLKLIIDTTLDDEAELAVTHVLCQPAPRLRVFKIYNHLSQFNRSRDPEMKLFAEHAPLLRLAKLHLDLKAVYGTVLDGVTELMTATTRGGLTHAAVAGIVSRFPNLRSFGLDIDTAHELHNGQRSIALPRSVEEVAIWCNRVDAPAAHVLGWLAGADTARRIIINCRRPLNPNESAVLLEQFTADLFPLTVLRIEACADSDALDYHFYDSQTDISTIGNAAQRRILYEADFSAQIPQNLFAHLTYLYMNEVVFSPRANDGTGLPPAPALRVLAIKILRADCQGSDGHDSPFVLQPNPTRSRFACPNLRVIQLAQRWDPRGIATCVAPEMVSEFLVEYLQYDAQKLDSLELHGVQMLTSNLGEVERLLSKVEEVVVVPGFVEWRSVDCNVLTWA